MHEALADVISSARQVNTAMRNHLEEVSKRGITLEQLDGELAEINSLEDEKYRQGRLKAELKQCTARKNAKNSRVQENRNLNRHVAKLALPKECWIEFGINARQ